MDGRDFETGILQGTATSLLTISYDQLGRRITLGRTGAGKTSYAYDNASRLQSLTDQLGVAAGGANDQALTFAYYASDQIKTKSANNSNYSWTSAASTNRPYTINGLNQYTVAGGTSYAYDPNGNLTQSGSTFFCYDTENRLVGEGASATDCSSVAQLTYDPLGRLVKTVGSATTSLVYDGDDLVAEYNSAGTLLRRYLHGPGTDDPLVQYEGATVAPTVERLLYSDAQGSIIAATDNAGNLMAGSIDKYDEYGIPLTDAAGHSLNSGRFQYTGQQWIPEIGAYYYKARFYSPSLGRFLQTDPIGYKDQINLYEYVGDDPVDHNDPSGLDCVIRNSAVTCTIKVVIPAGQKTLTPQQMKDAQRLATNYAAAVAWQLRGNRMASVEKTGGRPGTGPFNISGREDAQYLAQRTVYFRPGQFSKADMDTGGDPLYHNVFTNVFQNALTNNDSQLQHEFAHEGIHSSMQEKYGNMDAKFLGVGPLAREHQTPYNNAADQLLGDAP